MENKITSILKKEEGSNYVYFKLWQIILIALALVVIIVSTSVNGQGAVIWLVNFLLQLAVFTVIASIIAFAVEAIFKRGWSSAFAILVIICSLFGLYESIRGVNYRKTMEKAYQEQLQKQEAQQSPQATPQIQSN